VWILPWPCEVCLQIELGIAWIGRRTKNTTSLPARGNTEKLPKTATMPNYPKSSESVVSQDMNDGFQGRLLLVSGSVIVCYLEAFWG